MNAEHIGGLHDISLFLGKLSNQTETLLAQTKDLSDALDELQEKGSLTLAAVEGIKSRVSAVENTLEKAVLPSIADYKRVKQRGLGILGFVGMLSGALAAYWPRIVKAIIGGDGG